MSDLTAYVVDPGGPFKLTMLARERGPVRKVEALLKAAADEPSVFPDATNELADLIESLGIQCAEVTSYVEANRGLYLDALANEIAKDPAWRMAKIRRRKQFLEAVRERAASALRERPMECDFVSLFESPEDSQAYAYESARLIVETYCNSFRTGVTIAKDQHVGSRTTRWRWAVNLIGARCPACRELSMKTFPIDSPPVVPAHVGCHCWLALTSGGIYPNQTIAWPSDAM